MDKPELSIIIVSWNVKDLLHKALDSLYVTKQNINFEVIVVDNASSDASALMVANEFPQVDLVVNKKNTGFAHACNQGSDKAKGEYLLFLNDDTVVFDNTLDESVKYFKNNEKTGVLGCSIKNSDKTQQASVRRFPSLKDQIIVLLKLHNFFPDLLNTYLLKDFDYKKTQTVDQVMGAYFLTSREMYDRVNGFDEKYYFWYEEVDFCKNVKDLGYDVVYFSKPEIIHYGGASFKQWKALPEQKLLNNSLKVYFSKHKPKYQLFIIKIIIPINFILASLVGFLEFMNLNPKNKK